MYLRFLSGVIVVVAFIFSANVVQAGGLGEGPGNCYSAVAPYCSGDNFIHMDGGPSCGVITETCQYGCTNNACNSAPNSSSANTQTYAIPGTYTFTVPEHTSLEVQVWSAGGGGAATNGAVENGGDGGASSFSSFVVPGGLGGREIAWDNTTAGAGEDGTNGGAGGRGSYGAWNGIKCGYVDCTPWDARSGSAPGGGGGAWAATIYNAGGGKGGGYSSKTYLPGELSSGSTVTVTVGAGGSPRFYTGNGYYWYSGAGAPGRVAISWIAPPPNFPPTTPVIAGPTSGFTKTSYTYTFTATDPDSDTIRYGIDWNDNGTVDEWAPALGYIASGVAASTTHSWNSSNTQTFQVLAQDSLGNSSGWASYSVNMSPNAPTVLLTASPDEVSTGQSSTLTWSSSNANSCTGTNFSTGGATAGSTSVSPSVTTTYTVTCTGQGNQEASDSATVTVTCTPTYSCTDSTTVHSSCPAPSGTDTSCGSDLMCSEGASACISAPAPIFNGTGSGSTALSGHLHVRPSLLKTGERTRVFWNVSNVQTCTAVGDNTPADTWTENGTAPTWTSSTGSTGQQSAAIVQQTTFTLSCTALEGQTFDPETATVNVVPVFRER